MPGPRPARTKEITEEGSAVTWPAAGCARACLVGLLGTALVGSTVSLAYGDRIRPRGESARRLPMPVLETVGLASHRTIDVGDHAPSGRRDLQLRASVRGRAIPAADLTVVVAQYESPGGPLTPDPLISLPPVKLAPSKVTGSGATYSGTIEWASLHAAGRRIPLGQSALLCIRQATAGSGTATLPESQKAAEVQHGRDCIRLTRSGSPIGANRLVTGVLSDVVVEEASPDGRSYTLSYSAQSLSVFGDRPARTSKTIPFRPLASRSRWEALFETLTPTVELGTADSEKLVPARFGVPQPLGNDRYRSEFVFTDGSPLPDGGLGGQDFVIFANAAAPGRPDRSRCDYDPFALRPDFVPPNADFVGKLGHATITAMPGSDELELAADEPLFFNWFLSRGADCDATFTAPMPFRQVASDAGWRESFGTIEPNSALVWQDGKTSYALEFEQGRPRFDEESGKWISKIRPLVNGLVPARSGVDEFLRRHGPRLDVTEPYLFMDSTNSAANGGELWIVDENFEISYHVRDSNFLLQFTLKNGKNGWMGLGFHEFMFPADCIVAWMEESGLPIAWDCYNPGIPTLPSFPSPLQDTDPLLSSGLESKLDNVDNVTNVLATNLNGVLTISLQRPLITGDIFDFALEPGQIFTVCAAYNGSVGFTNLQNQIQPVHSAYGCTEWYL